MIYQQKVHGSKDCDRFFYIFLSGYRYDVLLYQSFFFSTCMQKTFKHKILLTHERSDIMIFQFLTHIIFLI